MYERHTRTKRVPPGRITMAQVRDICPDRCERQTWACGPAGMLDAAQRHWRRAGVGDRLRVERFPAADTAAPVSGGAGGRGQVRRERTHSSRGRRHIVAGRR
ncbi:hypothetical protein GCM10027610_039820 [Dactylosporangium cerinum]